VRAETGWVDPRLGGASPTNGWRRPTPAVGDAHHGTAKWPQETDGPRPGKRADNALTCGFVNP